VHVVGVGLVDFSAPAAVVMEEREERRCPEDMQTEVSNLQVLQQSARASSPARRSVRSQRTTSCLV
jgi:hypothetical protein